MHYIDHFYYGLFPLTLHVFRNFKVPSSGVCRVLPIIHILKQIHNMYNILLKS
jgi:hypothetical protein